MGQRYGLSNIKVWLARLSAFGRAPVRPVVLYRDPWEGDAEQGARIVGGFFRFDGEDYPIPRGDLKSGAWKNGPWPDLARQWFQSFVWLRDLRALGSGEARLTARALIKAWVDGSAADFAAPEAGVAGMRLASWLGHYEFCLLSAEENLQRRLMERVLVEGRIIAALLPLPQQGWRGLSALRGLLAAFMALPDQSGFLGRYRRYLPLELERLLREDGSAVERSPETQFQLVRELVEMSSMAHMMRLEVSSALTRALERAYPVLCALCHGDGALAVFNGALEHRAAEIDAILEQDGRKRVIAPAMPQSGYTRLALGRSVLIVDSGPPPPSGFDRTAHAGTLSFEFSHHHRRLFVNGGSAQTGAWHQALRGSAAHTLLVAGGESSSEFGEDGRIIRRPAHVECEHRTDGEAHWLELWHDGYRAPLGAIWRRSLYLGAQGEDLRGREVIEGEREVDFALRFHLHPDATAIREDEDVILRVENEMIWRFRQSGGVLSVEEGVYLGRGAVEKTAQIVVRPRQVVPAVAQDEQGGRTHQAIVWVLERVPS